MIQKMHKYYINQDYQMRVFNIRDNDHKMSRYYIFYNYGDFSVGSVKWGYVGSFIEDILKECDKEKIDYIIYYYKPGFFKQYSLKEFSVFRTLLEAGK